MNRITLVTGNKNKLKEFQEILNNFPIENQKIDLEEIQSLSLDEISAYKAKKAFEIIKTPVLVEDTGFFLEELNGLPGPFIKFFEEKLGNEASIKLLANSKNRNAKQICCVAFYDGKKLIIENGEMHGTITNELKQGEGFGFDFCFIPNGYSKTFSELGLDEKNKISARKNAIEKFKQSYINYNSQN